VKKQDTLENQARQAYLAIGSNLGNKTSNINIAKFELEKYKIKILKSSSNYISESWPNNSMPSYVNVIIKIKTSLRPLDLLEI
jgi:2-amino-4-hydroxy-6-hydroxymethyldihydropteridine diphosphokinase